MSISPQGPWGNCRGESRQELPEKSRKIANTQFHAQAAWILLSAADADISMQRIGSEMDGWLLAWDEAMA